MASPKKTKGKFFWESLLSVIKQNADIFILSNKGCKKRRDDEVFMHCFYTNWKFGAFSTVKNINMNIKTQKVLDTGSSVRQKRIFFSKPESYLRHYSHSFDWREKSTNKSSINLNNHVCQGLQVHLWQGKKCDAAECCVSSLLIFDWV